MTNIPKYQATHTDYNTEKISMATNFCVGEAQLDGLDDYEREFFGQVEPDVSCGVLASMRLTP